MLIVNYRKQKQNLYIDVQIISSIVWTNWLKLMLLMNKDIRCIYIYNSRDSEIRNFQYCLNFNKQMELVLKTHYLAIIHAAKKLVIP